MMTTTMWTATLPDTHFGRKTPKKGFYGNKISKVQDTDSELLG